MPCRPAESPFLQRPQRWPIRELTKLSQGPFGSSHDMGKGILDILARIDRICKALEDGLNDASWANERVTALKRDLTRLEAVKLGG